MSNKKKYLFTIIASKISTPILDLTGLVIYPNVENVHSQHVEV